MKNRAKKMQCAVFRALALCSVVLLSACSGRPSSSEATDAVRRLLADGGKLAGLSLPSTVGIKTVDVVECVDAKPLDGHYCATNVVSEEVPILGAVAVPMTLRFAKREKSWVAFVN